MEHEHIVYADRTLNQPEMKPLKNTLLIGQVTGNKQKDTDNYWSVTTADLPCSCFHCRTNPTSANTNCFYKNERNLVRHVIKIKGENEVEMDELGLMSLTNELLRKELNERGVQTGKGWTKPKLVKILTDIIEAETVNDDQDPVEIGGDVEDAEEHEVNEE